MAERRDDWILKSANTSCHVTQTAFQLKPHILTGALKNDINKTKPYVHMCYEMVGYFESHGHKSDKELSLLNSIKCH